eukprot:401255-Pelagomonas_calceolata.AAC.1
MYDSDHPTTKFRLRGESEAAMHMCVPSWPSMDWCCTEYGVKHVCYIAGASQLRQVYVHVLLAARGSRIKYCTDDDGLMSISNFHSNMLKEKKEKTTPAKRPCALRKGSLTSKLEKVSPKGPQT